MGMENGVAKLNVGDGAEYMKWDSGGLKLGFGATGVIKIENGCLKVYDSNGVVRVRLGDLSQ